jgi:hypothetical protein
MPQNAAKCRKMPQNAAKCRKFPLFNLTRNFEFFSTTLISREKMDLIGQNKEIFSNLNSNHHIFLQFF